MKKIITVLLVSTFLFSCGENKPQQTAQKPIVKKEQVAANLKSIAINIEGMTCEIGCARTIQSKLSKVDGVTYAKVNFDAKKGFFTYDSNKLSKNDLIKKIDGIAGGDLYKATKTAELDSIIK